MRQIRKCLRDEDLGDGCRSGTERGKTEQDGEVSVGYETILEPH